MVSDVPKIVPQRKLQGHSGDIYTSAVSQSGRAVTACSDNMVIVWDVTSGIPLRKLSGHTDEVTGCGISGNGMRAVTSSCDGTVRFWDTATGNCISTRRSPDLELQASDSVAYDCWMSTDGFTIAAVFASKFDSTKSDIVWYSWSMNNKITRSSTRTFRQPVKRLTAAPSANLLGFTTMDEDNNARTVHVVSLQSCEEHRTIALTPDKWRADIHIAGDSPSIFVADGERLCVLHLSDSHQDFNIPLGTRPASQNSPFCIDATGTRIVAPDAKGHVSVFDVSSRKLIATLEPDCSTGGVNSVAVAAQGSTILIGRNGGDVSVYSMSAIPESVKALEDVGYARSGFKKRGLKSVSLVSAMTDLHAIFTELKFERIDKDAMAAAIDSVLGDQDEVYITENQFVAIFQKLRRDAVQVADIEKAREEWGKIFASATESGNHDTLDIAIVAWRLIKKIHDKRCSNGERMDKASAVELLQLCAAQGSSTVLREEFLQAAEKAYVWFRAEEPNGGPSKRRRTG